MVPFQNCSQPCDEGTVSRSCSFNFLNRGESQATATTVAKQTIPPRTAAGTAPRRRATTPDSNSPNSLEEPIKMELTAEILPRIESGEESCTAAVRTTMLTLSKAPLKPRATRDRR